MVGTALSMRCGSVILPLSRGTLKSTRKNTVFPVGVDLINAANHTYVLN